MSALPMTSHSDMKRIEDYKKRLPVLEVYRCVQSEGSRFGRPTIAKEQPAVLTDVILVKEVGVILGILVYTQKKVHSAFKTL